MSFAARKNLLLVTAPTTPVVTTANAKLHLRVDHTNDDTTIAAFVKAATMSAEQYMGRSVLDTTWELWLDEARVNSPVFELPMAPLQSITSIKSYGDDNSATTMTASLYYADTASEPGRVALVQGNTWPTDLRDIGSLVVRYISGWGSATTNVPNHTLELIQEGIMLTVAAMYENRGDARPGGAFRFGLTDESQLVLWPLRVVEL